MAEPNRDLAPSSRPSDGELTYPEPAGIVPTSLLGTTRDGDLENQAGGGKPRLHSAAETIGGAMGSAVDSVRRLPKNVKSRLRVVGGRAVNPASDMEPLVDADLWADISDAESLDQPSYAIFDAAYELKLIASERAEEWSKIARDRAHLARIRAQYYADEYPVQTLLALAGVAFVTGCVLRIWRANRD